VVLLTGTVIMPPPGFIFRIVVEVAGLARLEEGDQDAGGTVACPG
jgi:hypothetical protein